MSQLCIIVGLSFVIWPLFIQLSHGFNEDSSRFKQYTHIKTKTPASVQAQAVKDLITRLIGPVHASRFLIVVNGSFGPAGTDLDTFQYVTDVAVGKVLITGTTGVAAALGFSHFLKYVCYSHVSWSGNQITIPDPFPVVKTPVTITSPNRFRYYQNVCSVSYSFAWWNWTRWEQEIDWMAMNGINLPLAFNGQEAIWQRVYLKMNLTQQELDKHFGGPAFLAWSRMGNIRGWAGPLSASWHANQLALQHQIVARMQELGMTPVFPAFAGHVPDGITRVYPNATVTRLGSWVHFNQNYSNTYLLEPSDPLFRQIGRAFIREYIAEFGTNHIYNADTFNEMTPRSSDPSYLSNASKAVYEGMLAGDPDAIWLMQGWLFLDTGFWKPPQVKALLHGVPLGKMIVLDLYAENTPVWKTTDSFYGQPFIWCMLHNFGGNIGLFGELLSVATGPISAAKHPGSTMIGTGITPEGIEQNYVMYELMNEMGWRSEPIELAPWLEAYSHRRYGAMNEFTLQAWKLLGRSVYNATYGRHHTHSVIVNKPSLTLEFTEWYKPEDVFQAWDALIRAADSCGMVEPFRYDLADVTRQSLQLLAISAYNNLVGGYINKSLPQVKAAATKLNEIFLDMDAVLTSNQYFLLGNWLNGAKSLATDAQESRLYEFNARNQITLWGPDANIEDYANKMWGGMVRNYYNPRWELFVSYLINAVSQGKPFASQKFRASLFDQETKWTFDNNSFPDNPVGDTLDIAKMLHSKYRPMTY
ncbi:alpha-N-acetylglucosaminidase-like [Montipora capricornis]|uniref:alpha-N-acetylglucosaminidase-like n=1 Tax=Montipora capricornis TaxID=246305 RepID=UPI0035F1D4CC